MKTIFLLILITTSLLTAPGCGYIAKKFTHPPNRGKTLHDFQDYTARQLDKYRIDQHFRLETASPTASLSVWIIEPKTESFKFATHSRKSGTNRDFIFNPPDDSNSSPPPPKATVIILHGLYEQKNQFPYWLWGQIIATAGYRVVMPDLRGHGHSTGQWITFGKLETRDISHLIDQLEQKKLTTGKLCILGGSLGAAIAIELAATDDRIDSVVALAPYSTLQSAAPNFIHTLAPKQTWFLPDFFIQLEILAAGRMANFTPANRSPLKTIAQPQKKAKTPILLVHGKEDKLIPYHHSQRLHSAAPNHTKLILLENETHLTIGRRNFYKLYNLIIPWFEQSVRF